MYIYPYWKNSWVECMTISLTCGLNLYFSVINYEITVLTGDVTFAGTNARVFIQIYGEKGKTEIITLESRSNNYERNTTEIFKVSNLGLFSLEPKCISVVQYEKEKKKLSV